MPAVVRAFAGDKVTCSVTGSVPIHTAILKNSIVLVNTTSIATIELHEEGNYNCVATSKYGTDEQMFSVILLGRFQTDDENPSPHITLDMRLL